MRLLVPGAGHAASPQPPRAPKATQAAEPAPWTWSCPGLCRSTGLPAPSCLLPPKSQLHTKPGLKSDLQKPRPPLPVSLKTLSLVRKDARLECCSPGGDTLCVGTRGHRAPVRAADADLQPDGTRWPRDISALRSLPQPCGGTQAEQLCLQLRAHGLLGHGSRQLEKTSFGKKIVIKVWQRVFI